MEKDVDDKCNSFTVKKNSAKTIADSKYINAGYLNARILRNKFENLELFSALHHYQITGISETWTDTKI